MNLSQRNLPAAVALAIAAAVWGWSASARAVQDVPAAPPGLDRNFDRSGEAAMEQEGVETLTRGPVHEALARRPPMTPSRRWS
jgi:hypothetical protein